MALTAAWGRFLSLFSDRDEVVAGEAILISLRELARRLEGKRSKPSRSFRRARARLAGRSASAPAAGRRWLQAARDAVVQTAAFADDLALFEVRPDAAMRELVAALHACAPAVRELLDAPDSRAALAAEERLRAGLSALRERYERAMVELVRRADAVEVLKVREAYRQLWRLGETVARLTRAREDDAVERLRAPMPATTR